MTREEWDKLTADEQWREYRIAREALNRYMPPGFREISQDEAIRLGMLDPQGNPPPAHICGDMMPRWYDGQWWTCFSSYAERKRANGEKP